MFSRNEIVSSNSLQAACLLTLELLNLCPESISSLSVSLSDKLKSMLLDNNLVFDEVGI